MVFVANAGRNNVPTFDFLCKKCGKTTEKFIRGEDVEWFKQMVCIDADCGGLMERQIGSGAGAIFKGEGFYCTDYRKKEEK